MFSPKQNRNFFSEVSHHRATGNQLQKRGSKTLKMCDKELGRHLPLISGHKIA